jgi:FMN phosphatase YigB (HAD superfamily)
LSNFKLILFDLDDTLIHFEDYWEDSVKETFRQFPLTCKLNSERLFDTYREKDELYVSMYHQKKITLQEYRTFRFIHIDRTAGEVSAKCHMEAMNILSLNLVHDIVIGKRTVDEARMFYAQTAEQYVKSNQTSPYTEQLLFPDQQFTNDPGISYFES